MLLILAGELVGGSLWVDECVCEKSDLRSGTQAQIRCTRYNAMVYVASHTIVFAHDLLSNLKRE